MELPTKRGDYSRYLEMVDPDTGEVVRVLVHNEFGQEVPDPVPVAPPLGYTQPLSMFDQMRAQIRAEHTRLRQLELEGLEETVEQANDFDVDEDIENMPSVYEERFDPVDFEVRNRLRQAEFRASFEAAVDKLPPQQKELLNGDNLGRVEAEQRGKASSRAGVRQPVEKSKGDAGKGKIPSDRGDVQEGDGEGSGGDE